MHLLVMNSSQMVFALIGFAVTVYTFHLPVNGFYSYKWIVEQGTYNNLGYCKSHLVGSSVLD